MKKIAILFAFILFANFGYAQNLVPNCSFEDTITCPGGGLGHLNDAAGWYSCGDSISSPDYFYPCGEYPNVPYNTAGFQYPATGNAYTGIVIYAKGFSNNKEFIETQLADSLQIGQTYFVSLKVSFTLNDYELGYAANKMGVLFSTIAFNSLNPVPINNFAHIYSNQIITDSVNWTTISGWVTADSTYKYISIGNFFDNAHTDTIVYNDSLYGAYYYIDDICVSLDSTKCNCVTGNGIENPSNSETVTIYPNPLHSNAIIAFPSSFAKDFTLELFDMMGRKMQIGQKIMADKILINRNDLPEGIYLLKINNSKKLFIQKIIIN